MPDKYKNHEFRIASDCGKFLYALCEAMKNADRQYRDGIIKDIRQKTEEMMYLLDRANRLKAGSIPRLQAQYRAVGLRDEIQTLLDPACRLAYTGTKKQGMLEKMLENLKQPLYNWYVSDLKKKASYDEQAYRKAVSDYKEALKNEEAIKGYGKRHPGEKASEALDMAESLSRVRYEQMTEARQRFDKAQGDLYSKMTKDYTLLADVLKEIEEEKTDDSSSK